MEGLEDGSWDMEGGRALPAPEDGSWDMEELARSPISDLRSPAGRAYAPSSICHIQFTDFPRATPAPSKRGDNFRTAHFRGGHAAETGLEQKPADALHLRECTLARVPVPAGGTTTSGRTAL